MGQTFHSILFYVTMAINVPRSTEYIHMCLPTTPLKTALGVLEGQTPYHIHSCIPHHY